MMSWAADGICPARRVTLQTCSRHVKAITHLWLEFMTEALSLRGNPRHQKHTRLLRHLIAKVLAPSATVSTVLQLVSDFLTFIVLF